MKNPLDTTYFRHTWLLILMIWIQVCFNPVTGQQDTTEGNYRNQQLWFDFTPHFHLSSRLQLYGELGYRTIVSEGNLNRFYIRPSAGYRIHRLLELNGGIGLFYDSNNADFKHSELRPWQGVSLTWPKSRFIQIKNYSRIEERFCKNEFADSFNYSTRFRHKFSLRLDFLKRENGSFWYLTEYGELFLPIDQHMSELYSNCARIGTGIGHQLASGWRISLLYNWQRSRLGPSDPMKLTDNIYRLRISKSLIPVEAMHSQVSASSFSPAGPLHIR